MTNEIIVFTHNDLDAMGCALNIEYRFPNIPKKYFYTNYGNIKERVQEIKDHVQTNGNKIILIADVSFSDNKDSLRELYNLGRCTHIDHHMYPDGFWDEFPNMKVIWDTKKSATLLCNEYFGNAGKHPRLDKLTRIIDIYDLWQSEEPEFPLAQDFNEYFWVNDFETLRNNIVTNDFKLPSDFVEVTESIKAKYTAEIADYEKRSLIQRAGPISLVLTPNWFNQIMTSEMANGQYLVVGINPYGIVRIRIKKDAPFTSEQKKEARLRLIGNSEVGHMDAFTYRYEGEKSFENTIKEAQRIVQVFNEV